MTTQEDWAFRAQFLAEAAKRADAKAAYFKALAGNYRVQSDRARKKADEPQEAGPGEINQIEREAATLLKTSNRT